MEWIVENYDKWLHFLVSAMLSVWMMILSKTSDSKRVVLMFVFCVLVAAGKELVFDLYLGYGNAEWLDFIYTMVLPIIAFIVSLKIIKK